MMSNTFWSNWMDYDQFRQMLFCSVARGASIRILAYHPDSDAVRLRAEDEEDAFLVIQHEKIYEMQQEINSTLNRIAEGWKNLPVSSRMNLEVCLTTQILHPVQLIRADDLMLICWYLSGKSGSSSPTIQLQGSGSAYWVKYEELFEVVWKRGEPASITEYCGGSSCIPC
jgi:hypothetical protein